MSEWPTPEEDSWAGWDGSATPRPPGDPPAPGRPRRRRPGRPTLVTAGVVLLALTAGGWYAVDRARQRAAAVAFVMPGTADGLPRSERPAMDEATDRTGARLEAAVPGRFTVTGAAYGDGRCRLALVVAAHRRGGQLHGTELARLREALLKAVPRPAPGATGNCPVSLPFNRTLRLDRDGGAVVLLNQENVRLSDAVLDDVLSDQR